MARARYPHLLPQDAAVWDRFLALHGSEYITIDYDIRVGDGRDPGPETPDNLRSMALDLSMRRIDAVGDTGDQIHIIEITRVAGLKALGQLLAYPTLYATRFPTTKPIIPILVAESFDSDCKPAFDTHKIAYHLV